MEVWDYTNRDEEILKGDSIPETLGKRILESDHFLPIISKNSVAEAKTYTHVEIKFALLNSKKILPIVLVDRAPSKWLGEFAQLSDRSYMEFELDNENDFELKIISLCDYFKVPYQPLVKDPYKLPLFSK